MIVGKLFAEGDTFMLKVCVSVAPEPSVALSTMVWFPASLLLGVPDNTPVPALKLNHEGFVCADNVGVSPLSISLAAKV